jgi:hypothetical protein
MGKAMSLVQFAVEPNLRSDTYFIALGLGLCEYCGRATRLLGLALPAGHETLDADADEPHQEAADVWRRADALAFVFEVEFLSATVQRRLRAFSSHYRREVGEHGERWLNHCEHCGAVQSDDALYCEPGGAFMPGSAAQATAVELLECPESFEAVAGGYSFEADHFELMRRV